jgi:hypothetical protein
LVEFLTAYATRISSLTVGEWVELRATLHAVDNRKYQCTECLGQYSGRSDAAIMTEKVRKLNGCSEIKNETIHHINREILFSTCIGNFFSTSAVQWLSTHAHFERGTMPYPGALMDQPNKALEIFRVIERHKFERAEAERAAEQRKARVNGR